ncbi:MAG TPA: hypothetical protein VG475_12780 [Pseudolabrys sp.]|nr:hypothetical protein [Pseudolabrys sp.]
MSILTHPPARAPRPVMRRRRGPNPLAAPLLVFAAVIVLAACYVAYVLWPRWPEAPVALDAPSLPIVVAGAAFNIEPAAIRVAVQRRPGAQERVDLDYLWPSLSPPDPARKPTLEALNARDRLFVTIASGATTLPIAERVKTIYPRYLAADAAAGPPGLSQRAFRDETAYAGEELIYDTQAPEYFFARCSRHGVNNAGMCLLERRLGEADLTFRFPREWLADWRSVAAAVDKLMARLHPGD